MRHALMTVAAQRTFGINRAIVPRRTISAIDGTIKRAVGGADGKVRLWEVETGRLIDTLQGHTAEIYSLAFSPDGKTLASVSQDETLRLWPIKK